MGHMVIGVFVYAEDEEDAMSEAQEVFEGLCGEGLAFDYFSTFDNGWATERWGKLPTVIRVCRDLGSEKCDTCNERFKCYTTQMNEMIEESMQKTRREFLEHFGEIKKYFTTHNDDELFEDDWFKYHCYWAGNSQGSSVWLYDQDGEGICETEHLNNVLSKWATLNKGQPDPELADKSIFLVPADVHY